MAANILETLKLEITCPLCLDVFKRPKKLPCDHVYCQECLCRLFPSQRREDNAISCPECRALAEVSSPDCSNFSTPFHVNRLIEMYQRGVREAQEESSDGPEVSDIRARGGEVTAAPASCGVHRSESLSLYCETCEKLVCRDCIMFSCAKSHHSYGFVGDMVEKHKSALSDSLFTVQELQQRFKSTLNTTGDFERNVDKEEKSVVEQVGAAFEELFDILKEEKSLLLTKVHGKFQVARTDNSVRRSQVAAVCSKLEEVLSSGNLSNSGASFFAKLGTRKAVVREVIKTALEVEHSDPVTLLGIEFSVLKPDKLRELCKDSITVSNKSNTLQCHFEGGIEWNNVPQLTVSVFPLHLDTHTSSLPELQGHLQSLHTKKRYPVDILKDTTKSYMVLMHPVERGRFELHIKHNDRHVSVSPIQLYVTVDLSSLINQKHLSFHQPMGIKCKGDYVLVSEFGSGLAVLRSRFLEKISTISMPDIWEVYLDIKSKRLYCTANRHHTLKMLTMEGEVLKCIGGKGNALGKFSWPNGIRCSKKGEIFVCDTMNDRIQVFDKDLNFLRMIDNSVLRKPDDLDFDEEGNLYVANQGAHNIAVLTPLGTALRTIGEAGHERGKLISPISVAVHRKWVYVTDTGNGRISVFTTAGEFVTTFGMGTLKKPECIAIDRDGYIYVTDNRSCVFVF